MSENQNFPSPLSVFEEDSDFHNIGSFDDSWHVNPFVFECVTSEGLDLDYARVEFNAPMPPSVTRGEPYATNEVSMSNYCRFAQVGAVSVSVNDIKCDFDLGVEFDSGPYDGAHYKFVLSTDHASWRHLILKMDLYPELLRWYLLVQQFDFEARDKGKSRDVGESIDKPIVYTLSNPKPS